MKSVKSKPPALCAKVLPVFAASKIFHTVQRCVRRAYCVREWPWFGKVLRSSSSVDPRSAWISSLSFCDRCWLAVNLIPEVAMKKPSLVHWPWTKEGIIYFAKRGLEGLSFPKAMTRFKLNGRRQSYWCDTVAPIAGPWWRPFKDRLRLR